MATISSSSPPTPTLRSPHTTHLHSPTKSPLLVLTRATRPAFLPYYVIFLTFLAGAFLLAAIPRWSPPPTNGSPASVTALLSRRFVARIPRTNYDGSVSKGGNFWDSSGNGMTRRDKRKAWVRKMKGCDLYGGRCFRDGGGGYPLYGQGSCPLIDEAFDCFGNGRRDSGYAMYRTLLWLYLAVEKRIRFSASWKCFNSFNYAS